MKRSLLTLLSLALLMPAVSFAQMSKVKTVFLIMMENQ
jgi:hypothetical protein